MKKKERKNNYINLILLQYNINKLQTTLTHIHENWHPPVIPKELFNKSIKRIANIEAKFTKEIERITHELPDL